MSKKSISKTISLDGKGQNTPKCPVIYVSAFTFAVNFYKMHISLN